MKRLVLLLSVLGAALQADLALVSKGASEYVIVRPAKATTPQLYAAEELRDIVKAMTGATLAIQTDAGALPPKAILLGVTKHTEKLLGAKVDLKKLGDDGFRIKACSPHLVIAGSGVRGTLYGVYELLERYGGCRWYASFFSVTPNVKDWSVPDALDDTQIPAFVMREPFWFDMFKGDFAARSRANGNRMAVTEKHGGKIRFGAGLFVHTFNRLMPPGEFFAEHPEYFSEIKGKRVADHSQLCLSNPDVIRICTERLLARIRTDPDAKLYSLSQNDWRGYCTCPKCKALDDREETPAASVIHFVNQVAAEVEKEFPNAWIETLAYQYTRKPPKTLRPRHNVVPRLCTIECDFSLPLDKSPYPQNARFVEEIKGWSKVTDKLYIWDYTTNFGHYVSPHPNFACLKSNAQFFRDNNVVGLFEQGAYQGRHAEFAELRAWVLAKLLWNPDQDVNALYDDFFAGYYGNAAPFVRKYWDELHTFVTDPAVTLNIWTAPQAKYYPDGFFERSLQVWKQAEAAVANDPLRSYNVRMSALPVYYALLQRMGGQSANYIFEGNRFVPKEGNAEYASLAKVFLDRFAEAKDIRISENMDRHNAFLTSLRSQTEGFGTVSLTGDGYQASVVGELGGRVCRLSKGGGPNLLDPNFGIDAIQSVRNFTLPATQGYGVTPKGAATADISHTWRRQFAITRTAKLTAQGLTMTNVFASHKTATQTMRPVLRAALDLGNASAVCLKPGAGAWQTEVVAEDQVCRLLTCKGALPGQVLTVASPVTGRAATVQLPANPIDHVQVLCDVRNGRTVVMVALAEVELAGHQKITSGWRIAPVDGKLALPAVKVPKTHRADRLTIEDYRLSIGRRGEWGDHVKDPIADDGAALKLYNTHYEWCAQWRVDPSWFEEEGKYTVRMRVRVEKSGKGDGEAFWAGVYDVARKRSYGEIRPKVSEVKDGYQWYDVATWKPELKQYVWIGPGNFDKATLKTNPAIKAVYIDRIELVRVKE
jgi:hypothetical protein